MHVKVTWECFYSADIYYTELKAFLLHVMGSYIAQEKSIMVTFIDDAIGSISAHTCSNSICLPDGLYRDRVPSFDHFKSIMNAVIDWKKSGLNFNTV